MIDEKFISEYVNGKFVEAGVRDMRECDDPVPPQLATKRPDRKQVDYYFKSVDEYEAERARYEKAVEDSDRLLGEALEDLIKLCAEDCGVTTDGVRHFLAVTADHYPYLGSQLAACCKFYHRRKG